MAFGRFLPKIELRDGTVIKHSLQFTNQHAIKNLTFIDQPEYDVSNIRLADNGRTLTSHFAGYRFLCSFDFDDHMIPDTNNQRAAVLTVMELMQSWLYDPSLADPIIRVYPCGDLLTAYDCRVPDGGYTRMNYSNEGGTKTVAFVYTITLQAIKLSATKMQPIIA